MTTMVPVLTLMFGALIGCATFWFLFLPRERALAMASVVSESHHKDTVISTLESSIKSQDAYLVELKQQRADVEAQLFSEVRGRTAAEQQCSQIAPLQLRVDKLTEAEKCLNENITGLRIEAEKAKAGLKVEREKVAHLDDAERKLSDVFNSLASRALQANNQSFLGLANEKFETIREAAKAELDGRKAAFDQTVSPIKECLEKVDQKIQQLEVARQGAYQELQAQVHELKGGQSQLYCSRPESAGCRRVRSA